ncbi:MAG: HEPN domain-containing protein [Candidatus Marinimicrobia bacterium]|nr:HEPN domain-containing protein [Candidatus Neomarinimicrobiota bacterium]
MIDELSKQLSLYRLNKAKDLLSQAKLLHENKKYDGSINRSYYAIFNAIRALLALSKIDNSKHSGVLSYFDRYFVKTKILSKKYSKIATLAFDSRQDYDYEDFYIPTNEESEIQITDSENFITEIEMKSKQLIDNKIQLPEIELQN